ncbi:MAG: FmdB family transcriptional regulator [Planctomycetota bacterium]
MPTYEYELLDADGEPTGDRFEWTQSMKDDALTAHPETGKPCRRAIVPTRIAGKWSPIKEKSTLSNKNLERLGFTKYEKKGDGVMERVAGKEGPRVISDE